MALRGETTKHMVLDKWRIFFTDKASQSWIGGLGGAGWGLTSNSLWAHFDFTLIPLWVHFELTLNSLWFHFDSLGFYFDIILIPLWFHIDFIRFRRDFTLNSIWFHCGFTFMSHCIQFEFTLSSHWISQRVHFDFTFDLKGKGKASRHRREKLESNLLGCFALGNGHRAYARTNGTKRFPGKGLPLNLRFSNLPFGSIIFLDSLSCLHDFRFASYSLYFACVPIHVCIYFYNPFGPLV